MAHPLNILQEKEPWYKDGLKFQCNECGRCCSGFPGAVWITEDEIKTMATYLHLEPIHFMQKYVRSIDGKLSLIELEKQDFACVFLKQNKCSIYQVRPKQCRTFPWWQKNLKSENEWKEAALYCEGISENAPIVPLTVIHEQLSIQEGKP